MTRASPDDSAALQIGQHGWVDQPHPPSQADRVAVVAGEGVEAEPVLESGEVARQAAGAIGAPEIGVERVIGLGPPGEPSGRVDDTQLCPGAGNVALLGTNSPTHRRGTMNACAVTDVLVVIGGYRRNDGRPAPNS